MKKIFLLYSMFVFALLAHGQSKLIIKDSLLYTHTDLLTTKLFSVLSLIDTGCSLCVIDSTFAKDTIGLIIEEQERVSVNTKSNRMSICIVDSIRFCGKIYRKVYCIVADLKGTFQRFAPDFILGADILRDRPLKFDCSSLIVEPVKKHRKEGTVLKWESSDAYSSIPVGYMVFETKIQGENACFVFDTGSRNNKLPNNIHMEPSGLLQKESADINHQLATQQLRLYKNVKFQIGKQIFTLDFLEGKKEYGLLGLGFLGGRSFILNYGEKTLEILPF
ncbi:MAG: hypothetical protein II934_09035 [Prevotella sp.]|nr:hypothetical protein [Prevotella sp.]